MEKIEWLETRKGRPSLLYNGYRYNFRRANQNSTTRWVCAEKDCGGSVTTDNTQPDKILNRRDHSCIADTAKREVEKCLVQCRKRAREERLPIPEIVRQEFSIVIEKGLDSVTQIPTLQSIKSGLYNSRHKALAQPTVLPKSSSQCVQFHNICRTCLSQEPSMKSIFDIDSNSGETLQLFEMLMSCTSVQVQEGDGLPAQICLSCINKMGRALSFKKLCENSDATLRTVLSKSTISDDEPLTKPQPFVNVALCSQETVADIDTDMLDIKMKFEEEETNSDDPSRFCPANVLASDTEFAHFETDPITVIKHEIKDDRIMQDEIDIKSDVTFPSHIPDETEQPIYPCQECTDCFTLEHDLKTHHSDAHRTSTRHTCAVCSKDFAYAGILRRHAKVHTNVKPFGCKVCEKRFARSFGLLEHMRAHSNEKNFICSECGKRFARRNNHDAHKKLHFRTTTQACNVCGKQFSKLTSLAQHMKAHAGVKDHVCSYCGNGFSTASNLKVHITKHTGENRCICNVCNRGFTARSLLDIHMRAHTGEKPYACNLCPKAFTRGTHLRAHLQRHTGKRDLACDHCEKTFYSAYNLKVHLRVHTGEKPYTCNICNESFSMRRSIVRHLRTHR